MAIIEYPRISGAIQHRRTIHSETGKMTCEPSVGKFFDLVSPTSRTDRSNLSLCNAVVILCKKP